MRILVIEDELEIAQSIVAYLNKNAIRSEYASDFNLAKYMLHQYEKQEHPFDFIIVDLGLPRVDGFEIIKYIRKQSSIPILILTARDDTESKLRAFNLGADDYMVKPFSLEEMLARIQCITSRYHLGKTNQLIPKEILLGNLCLMEAEQTIYKGSERLDLPIRELELLTLLMSKQNQTLSKHKIQEVLTKDSADEKISTDAIEVYICRLRKKIENSGVVLHTIRGIGYMLKAEKINP
jgi:DNA-binding response OmpR family regulator